MVCTNLFFFKYFFLQKVRGANKNFGAHSVRNLRTEISGERKWTPAAARFWRLDACAERLTPTLKDCIFWTPSSLYRLLFHYGFVGKLVYLLITYTGGLRRNAARITQVSLYSARGRMACLREGGVNAKCEIKL